MAGAGGLTNLLGLLAVLLAAVVVGGVAVLLSEYLSLEAGAFFLAHARRLKLRKQARAKVREKHGAYLDEVRAELGLKGAPLKADPPFQAPPPGHTYTVQNGQLRLEKEPVPRTSEHIATCVTCHLPFTSTSGFDVVCATCLKEVSRREIAEAKK